jgi:LCP family protein required for cell wall assembly
VKSQLKVISKINPIGKGDIMQDRKEEDLLKQQILEIMKEEQSYNEQKPPLRSRNVKPVKKKKHRAIKVAGMTALALLLIIAFIIGTKSGRRLIYRPVSDFIYSNVDNEDIIEEYQEEGDDHYTESIRQEDYITNYLIFGIEEFGGARNTDSIMIASINTKDDTVKLTSLLRDSYVEIPDHNANKLNSAYSKGGARMMVDTIELNYKIKIDGYVSVDFKSFEKIVDLLGGVTIELGKEEAKYLNTTNYISKKSNRNVKAGVNKLNGNQVMGYCRVRKVKTLGGANNDYGRIVRQQRALKAIFDSYKSPKNLFKILSVTKKSLGYVTTNLTQSQIEKAVEDMVENKIKKLDTFRIPVDGAFDAPRKYNGIGYPIVLDWDTNRIELYKFIFDESEKEAKTALASQK